MRFTTHFLNSIQVSGNASALTFFENLGTNSNAFLQLWRIIECHNRKVVELEDSEEKGFKHPLFFQNDISDFVNSQLNDYIG